MQHNAGVFRELKAIQKQRNSLCAAGNTGGHDVDDKWAAAHGNLPATPATRATRAIEAQISARVMHMSLTALYRESFFLSVCVCVCGMRVVVLS
jgi:hypothetical protein